MTRPEFHTKLSEIFRNFSELIVMGNYFYFSIPDSEISFGRLEALAKLTGTKDIILQFNNSDCLKHEPVKYCNCKEKTEIYVYYYKVNIE